MFVGFVDLESSLTGSMLTVDVSAIPTNADALPKFRVYGPNGFVESGTVEFKDTGTITGATNASPIVITSVAHGLTTGTRVTITGVGGNTAANATWVITRIDADTFSLTSSTGDGAYTSGGTWNITGLYGYEIDAAGVSAYEKNECYQILFTYAISSVQKGQLQSFNVC